MKKKNTLKKNWEFQRIIKGNKSFVTKFFVLYFEKHINETRIGVSISKRFGNAVFRNKYKRVVKQALDIIKPWDKKILGVIIVRKPFFQLKNQSKIINEIVRIIRKV